MQTVFKSGTRNVSRYLSHGVLSSSCIQSNQPVVFHRTIYIPDRAFLPVSFFPRRTGMDATPALWLSLPESCIIHVSGTINLFNSNSSTVTRAFTGFRNKSIRISSRGYRFLRRAIRLIRPDFQLKSGAFQLLSGASQLLSGGFQLLSGSSQLLSGASQLLSGSSQLLSGTSQLLSGDFQLLSGTPQLLSGDVRFLRRGIGNSGREFYSLKRKDLIGNNSCPRRRDGETVSP